MPSWRDLGLDKDTAQRLAVCYAGFAVAKRTEAGELLARHPEAEPVSPPARWPSERALHARQEQALVSAASSFAIAGSLLSLDHPALALAAFRAGAEAYDELGLPYAAVLAVCARHDQILRRHATLVLEAPLGSTRTRDVLSGILVAARMALGEPRGSATLVERMLAESAPLVAYLAGSALLPVKLYRDLLREVWNVASGDAPPMPRATITLLERAAERLEGARANRYHWSRFQSGLLPVEPELIAAMAVAVPAWQHVDRSLSAMIMKTDLPPIARIPMEVAQSMAEETTLSPDESRLVKEHRAFRVLWEAEAT